MARKGPIIPTMRVKDEPLEHIHRRNNIRELERKVDETKTLQYNKEELYNVSIHTYPMTMNQNREPMFYPCFFTPYKGNLNAEPYDEEQEAQGWKWDPYEEEDSTTSLDWAVETSEYFHDYISAHECEAERNGTGDLAFVDLNPPSFFPIRMSLDEFKGPNTVEWFARGIGFVRKSPLPHFMSLMVSDIDGDDDKITRGELLCILRIIERLLVTVKFVKHMITPVLVFSFMGPRHARLLQAYYNGNELVIHKTELFDFTKEKNTDALLLFTRFLASSPTGDTTSAKRPLVK